MSVISVRGATEHNLRNVSVDIPKNKLIAFTGVSGSGKSSLIFDTVYVEAFRRFAGATAAPVYLMGNSMWTNTSRPKYRAITGLPPALGLSQQQGVAGKLSTVGTLCGASDLLRVYFAAFGDVFCRNCNIPLKPTTYTQVIEHLEKKLGGKTVSILAPIAEKRKGAFEKEIEKFRQLGFSKIRINGEMNDLQDERSFGIDAKKLNTIDVVIDHVSLSSEKKKRIERAVQQAIEHGKGVVKVEGTQVESIKFNTNASCPQCGESSPRLDPRHFSHSSLGQCGKCHGTGSKDDDHPADLFPCGSCHGTRLSKDRPIVRIDDITFESLHQRPIAELEPFVQQHLRPLSSGDKAKMRVVDELSRLSAMLVRIGLGHLTLNRSGASLAPGDLQRLRLSSMLSNKLTGALYVLDEPCQGLTAEEVDNLAAILKTLVKEGSTVLAVEHHPEFLKHCDEVFVMGPGAGIHGGEIVEITTGKKYEEKLAKLKLNGTAKKNGEYFQFSNFHIRNLSKQKNVKLFEQSITVIRGPAGHGKSTFLEQCLLPTLLHLVEGKKLSKLDSTYFSVSHSSEPNVTFVADVRPGSLMRTSRRSVAAALDVLVPLREIFAQLPASQVLGLTESHFSWHSKLGRCDTCEGRGYIEIPQRFGAPVRVTCETCLGAKLSGKSLLPRFKGYNLDDLMQLSIEEALQILGHVRVISSRLSAACEFGLGYIKLGQGMDSLSGGELQRLTLTMELRRANLQGAWFLLVHPGTGLHAPDIEILGKLMRLLVERGAAFVVLENREEFMEYADHIVKF